MKISLLTIDNDCIKTPALKIAPNFFPISLAKGLCTCRGRNGKEI